MPSLTPTSAPRLSRTVAAILTLFGAAVLALLPSVLEPAGAVPLSGVTTSTNDGSGSFGGTIRRSEVPGHPIGGYYVRLDPYTSATTTSYTATADENGRFSLTGIAPGSYQVKVGSPTESYYMGGNEDLSSFGGSTSWSSMSPTYFDSGTTIDADLFVPFQSDPLRYERERVAGADRYDTAARTSQYGFIDPAPLAFIASGENFPDALSAAPAAAQLGAPLLLTARSWLPASTVTELQRLQTQHAVVVGGEAVVSASVEAQLEALGITVERLWGADRYATSIAVAQYAFTGCGSVNIATGLNFPDALALSAMGGPLFLVNGGDGALRADTRQAIDDLGCTDARIAGGTAVVSSGIENELRAATGYVARFAGADRYETSRKIAYVGAVQRPHVFVASGSNFPDALAAAAYAARIGAPVYLVHGDCVPAPSAQQMEDEFMAVLTIVGGESVLSPGIEYLYLC